MRMLLDALVDLRTALSALTKEPGDGLTSECCECGVTIDSAEIKAVVSLPKGESEYCLDCFYDRWPDAGDSRGVKSEA